MNFEQLLRFSLDQHASDIHLQPGAPPALRIAGQLRTVEGQTVPAEELQSFIASIAPPDERHGPVFARTIEGVGRFRGTVSSQMGAPALVLRHIPTAVPGLDGLGLPPVVQDVALARRGLTLVTGTGGSGRSTTLAAMIDRINAAATDKIITIEEPVEYVIAGKKSVVSQREVGRDAATFDEALKVALREDADVIALGELRDAATLRLVLRAAESGQQVLAAFHANGTATAVERLLMMLPNEERKLAAVQITTTLEAVIAQRMATTKDGARRPVVEVLRNSPLTARSIMEGRFHDLANFLASRQAGMQQFDQHILDLYQSGVISGTEAMRLATNPEAVAADLRNLRRKASA
jgi:pilus retraction protein PilT